METIQVFVIDMPYFVDGITVKNCDDSYTILINAKLSAQGQCGAYDHEMEHINNHDFDHFCDVNQLELIRNSA